MLLKLLLKPYSPLNKDREVEIALIRELDGYKAILEEIDEMAENCKRIDWLSANYGKIKSDQIGHLPLGGLIASDTLEALKEKLNG